MSPSRPADNTMKALSDHSPTPTEHDSPTVSKVDEKPNHGVVDFEGPDDVENPRNWPSSKKNLHVIMISLFTLNA
jgi:hypothetical protein